MSVPLPPEDETSKWTREENHLQWEMLLAIREQLYTPKQVSFVVQLLMDQLRQRVLRALGGV